MYLFDQDGFTAATATMLIVIKSQLKQLSTLKKDDFNMLSSTQTNPQGSLNTLPRRFSSKKRN